MVTEVVCPVAFLLRELIFGSFGAYITMHFPSCVVVVVIIVCVTHLHLMDNMLAVELITM